MGKGEQTKQLILDTGFEMASTLGLECLSIGTLAKETGLSKSGLFGHFNSKENLQLSVVEYAGDVFRREVIIPALKIKAGIPRIAKMNENWIKWTKKLSGGCIFVGSAAEYADRPGPIRNAIRKQHDDWIDCLKRIARSAVNVGEFKEDTDCELFAFELYSLALGFHLYHSSLDCKGIYTIMDKAFEHLIDIYKK